MTAYRRLITATLAATTLFVPAELNAHSEGKGIVHINPETGVLERFFGVWFVTEQHFDENGQAVGTVKGQEEIEWVLDDHAIRRTYRTGEEPSAFEAIGYLSWSTAQKAYRGFWMNNRSTLGPTTVTGEWTERTETFAFDLKSIAADGKSVHYRVVDKFIDANARRATTYTVDGEKLVKRMEVSYKRAEPCPDAKSRMRPIGGP